MAGWSGETAGPRGQTQKEAPAKCTGSESSAPRQRRPTGRSALIRPLHVLYPAQHFEYLTAKLDSLQPQKLQALTLSENTAQEHCSANPASRPRCLPVILHPCKLALHNRILAQTPMSNANASTAPALRWDRILRRRNGCGAMEASLESGRLSPTAFRNPSNTAARCRRWLAQNSPILRRRRLPMSGVSAIRQAQVPTR